MGGGLRVLAVRRRLAAALIASLALTPLSSGPTPAAPVSATSGDGCQTAWTTPEQAESWQGFEVTAAAALDGAPAWAAGSSKPGVPRIGIARWTGSGWLSVVSPWTEGAVNAISAFSSNVAWAVGDTGQAPLVGRWDGTQWTRLKPPALTGVRPTLTDVVSTSGDVAWMTGARLIGGRLKPVIVKRTLSGWKVVSPPLAATTEAGLTSIARDAGGRLWVGGWRAVALQPVRPWLLYRSGKTWRNVSLDTLASGRAAVTDIAFGTGNVGWVTGYVERAGSGYEPLLQRWDGTRWANETTPWTAQDSVILEAVAVDGGGAVTVAGTKVTDAGRWGVVATLANGEWRVTNLEPVAEGRMMDVVGLRSGSLAVGIHRGAGAAVLTCAETAAPAPAQSRRDRRAFAARELEHAHQRDYARAPASHAAPPGAAEALPGLAARDVTEEAGLAMTVRTYSSLTADFDADGHVDILLNRHTEAAPELWLGTASGRFEKSAAVLPRDDRHICDVADIESDDDLDLFCAVGGERGRGISPNEILVGPLDDGGPTGTGGGTERTLELGLLDAFGRGRAAVFLNLDRDAYPDLFLTNQPDRVDGMAGTNRLYRNDAGTRFASVPAWGVDRSLDAECAVAADIDADADDDLILCAHYAADNMAAGVRVYVNDGARFVDRTMALGLVPGSEIDAEPGDFDGDGRLDVAVLRRNELRVYRAEPGGGFTLGYSAAMSSNVAMAIGDVNGDQRPDVFVARHNASDLMLVNDGTGSAFQSMTIPQPSGSTDDVIALDYDGNGLTDFLSLNGIGQTPGPLMLIAFFETPPPPPE
jgi:hypothetical protein